jgi:hypothetical protein
VTTVIAILVFALLFTLFALLGPAERSRTCGGRTAGEERCGSCPLGPACKDPVSACPGARALETQARKRKRGNPDTDGQ